MKWRHLAPWLVIGAGFLVYCNSLVCPFVYDDFGSILQNPTIRRLWPIWQPLSPPHRGGITVEGRPIVNVSLALNYAISGYQPWSYHGLNILLHVLSALALMGIVRRTLLQPVLRPRFHAAADRVALAVAVLWVVHPLTTESVTYVVQRAESLMGLFYFLTLYAFIRGAESPRARLWFVGSVTTCALGMASKEVMASAPVVVLLYDAALVSGSVPKALRSRWPYYLALAGTWIVLACLVVYGGTLNNLVVNAKVYGVTRWRYLLTQSEVIPFYLRLAIFPHPLCFDYYGWPLATVSFRILPAVVLMIILLGLVVRAWNQSPALGFVGAFFFLVLAPSSSIFPLDSPAYEHRMYVPLAAVVALGVLGIDRLLQKRSRLLYLTLAIGLGILTWQRNREYKSEFALWQDTVRKRPDNPRAHVNLGVAWKGLGNIADAIEQFQQALLIKPDLAEAHYNLGLMLAQSGRTPEAIAEYQKAVHDKPGYADAYNNWGKALCQLGKLTESIDCFHKALRIRPAMPEAQNNLGVVLVRRGRITEALRYFEAAVRDRPDYAEAHCNFGGALAHLGRWREAIEHYQEAVRIKPDYAEAHMILGNLMLQSGHHAQALAHCQRALQLQPDSTEAQNNLAWLLATLEPAEGGDPARAVTLAERACELTGNRMPAYLDTLAAAYAATGQFTQAVAVAQTAVNLARSTGNTDTAAQIETRLALYNNGQVYMARRR
jgi:tetratricopeptide (TPR) repeat protein